jgi:microcystin-dependent protein
MAFIGTVRATAFAYAEVGWLPCDGRILPIQQYQALYAVIGNAFGLTDDEHFMLPNLNGCAVAGQADGFPVGTLEGSGTVALTSSQMAAHTHVVSRRAAVDVTKKTNQVNATTNLGSILHFDAGVATVVPSSDNDVPPNPPLMLDAPFSSLLLSPAGGGQPHENRQPFLVMTYSICTEGEFPVPP